MRKNISRKRLNNRRRVKKTRRHNMKGGSSVEPLYVKQQIIRNGIPVKRIVLYALSANPPTKAHKNIIQQLSRDYDAVFVWASTNLNKLDPTHKDYDPLYKDENTRSKFLIKVLTGLENVKVDYDINVTPAKYNNAYTGISVKKFIDANLVSNGTINSDGNDFKNFKLNETSSQGDVEFLKRCGITNTDILELWVCFGTDVVRDTPTWTPNNVFLTKATGIVMIPRKGINDLGTGLYSKVYKKPVPVESESKSIYRFKMPFLDCTTIGKEGKFIQRDLNFNTGNFPALFADTAKDMYQLAEELIDASHIQFNSINEGKSTRTEQAKRDKFLGWLSAVDNKFSLLIEESLITLAGTFAEASSTKVRNLAVHSILGNNREQLKDQLLQYVNSLIIDDIYTTYGNPTIAEQLAIVQKKEPGFLTNKVLEIMKVQ
jgi:nicotinic acid mononucleotide adenylyltransferase